MSINFKSSSIEKAAQYNARTTYMLPPYVLSTFPALAADRGSVDFASEVRRIQSDVLGLKNAEVDAMLGRHTYEGILRHCLPINSEYVVFGGVRIAMPVRQEYKLITFDEPGGLDLHKYGKFSRRPGGISGITCHWGGLDALHCFRCFSDDARDVSSHFLIGKTANNEITVFQVLDMSHAAWHGGPRVNKTHIGLDICQSPEMQWEEHYTVVKRGMYNVKKVDNTSGRGPKRVLSLDPQLAAAAGLFIQDLANAMGLPFTCPPTHDVVSDVDLKKYGVVGHHHVSERKYDIACWWTQVFGSALPCGVAGGASCTDDCDDEDDSNV